MNIRLFEQSSTRIPGVTDYTFIREDVQPPSYLSIETSSPEPNVTLLTPNGPFTEEQFELFSSMPGQNLSGAEFAKLEETPLGYCFDPDTLRIRGEYPGGTLRAAVNLANLVFAAEVNLSPEPLPHKLVAGYDQMPG